MNDLHPHWQSTGDEDPLAKFLPREADTRSTGSSEPEPAGVHIAVKSASRLPAAILGVAIFTIAGVTVSGGWQDVMQALRSGTWHVLTAQIGSFPSKRSSLSSVSNTLSPVEIRISAHDGFQPEIVMVRPGQQIIWVNDQSIPHIITSQTLRDGSGAYLNTPAIFPGATATFTVGPREPDRRHSIASTTDQTLIGTIDVNSRAEKASSSSPKAPLGRLDDVELPSVQRNTDRKTSSSSLSKETSATTSSAMQQAPTSPVSPMEIEANPYANMPATIDMFAPQDTTYQATALSQNVIAPETPQVKKQPDTGPGLWTVCLISIAILLGVTRKYFVRPIAG